VSQCHIIRCQTTLTFFCFNQSTLLFSHLFIRSRTLTSSFSMRVSMVMRTSSCTSKWKSGPDLPRALVTIRS
jgi:hypothetical protein